MRHNKPYRKLSRQRHHYRALMRNMALSLLWYERIQTTVAKAKELRRFVEKIVNLGKKGTLHDRRLALALLGNIKIEIDGKRVDVLKKVFKELPTRLKKHVGGCTRITKIGYRPGDAAPICIMELVDAKVVVKPKKTKKEAKTEEAEQASA